MTRSGKSFSRKAPEVSRDRLPIRAGIQPEAPVSGQVVELYSDGACDTTKGHGGWATILRSGEHELVISGNEENTTNNRMELRGLLEGLRMLKRPCQVKVITDSQYLRKAFTDGWILNWQRNGWKTASKEPVKNQDLWEELIELARVHALTFLWVKGHAGHGENERVDELAVLERKKLRK
ncbi:ribonuclease HI [Deinococcus wulumuqiensis]|uniref:Ribonuclease H n=1 Tax=Deinococcus wulumuqiensis TaxID=980427 RepID=A0A345IGU5_9DEIO|nr:ribonuclease HI [Deinococcus wulumuqiensis]AXG98917.1 ribonuclease HI [Deinococcus wulumuqiensis]QII20637.1 ribonuclease HI [Deinococcus wulumuqiensis R12]GGI72970.1 ribonuclease H [Deinococcus wulumuqiensis]GGP28596.1 ribonuclease H [Deinococcus wulumuqiensis]